MKNTDMKKIMFNDRYGLTQAVLEGRKTMTRRVIPSEFFSLSWDVRGNTLVYENADGDFIDICNSKYCRYKIGEIVAVAQSYENAGYECYPYRDTDEYLWLRRDGQEVNNVSVAPAGVTNKLFVRADLMPHHIRITDIRIKRLQDISDEDCLREGVRYIPEIDSYYFERTDREEGFYFTSPRAAFAELIDRVSGRGTYDRNPYVVAYEFELLR